MEIRSEPSIRGFLSRTPEQKSKPGEVFLLVAQIGQKFRRREEDGTFTLVGSAYIDLIMIGDKAEEAFRQSLLGSQGSLGVFFSNGPGDPEPCDYAIQAIRDIVDSKTPMFGICLGHQLLGLASGAKTVKMKFGHHGATHPVKDLESGRVAITSQNHGFAVDAATLPANLKPTHVSLFDNSLQGMARTDAPAFSFQGHPEASPGPHDVGYLFDRFVSMMEGKSR